jgi:hypothetical protein
MTANAENNPYCSTCVPEPLNKIYVDALKFFLGEQFHPVLFSKYLVFKFIFLSSKDPDCLHLFTGI